MVKNKKSDQAHFILGFMGDGRNYEGRYAQSVLSVILGGGMSSRLFIEVRERRGLAYGVRTSSDRYQDTGYIGTYVGTDPKKAQEAIKVVLDEHYLLASKEKPVSIKEFSKAKEYLKGHAALALEDTSAVGEYFAFQELFGNETITPEELFKRIDKVTLDEVYAEAKRLFSPKRLNLGIIGPFTEMAKFEKLLK
jgi:predicted Zn-dependent peptidase